MKNTITEDLIGRLQRHVRTRGAPSIKNGAWAMMLEAATQLQTLQKAVFELQEMVSNLEEQRDTLNRIAPAEQRRHNALLARLAEPTEKMVFAAALADRIKREEGSREIDAEIWAAVKGNGQPIRRIGPSTYNVVRLFCNPNPEAVEWVGYDLLNIAEPFTTGAPFDLTAAMSLVPAGREVSFSYCGEDKTWEVIIDPAGGMDYNKTGRWHDIVVSAKTLKSALCAAALRAQAAEIER